MFLFTDGALAQNFSPEQKKEIESIIHDYLIANPDVLREAQNAMEEKDSQQQAAVQKKVIAENADLLFRTGKNGVIGNPNGDVTLVEFFDYNCGYCRRAEADLQQMIKNDPKLRVVLKEFPVLGPSSVDVALISAQLIGDSKYGEFRKTLISAKGEATKERALGIAKDLGLDSAKLEAGMKDAATRDVIKESLKLADALLINGTPGYVISDEVLLGAVGYEALKKRIDNVRKCGKAAC